MEGRRFDSVQHTVTILSMVLFISMSARNIFNRKNTPHYDELVPDEDNSFHVNSHFCELPGVSDLCCRELPFALGKFWDVKSGTVKANTLGYVETMIGKYHVTRERIV